MASGFDYDAYLGGQTAQAAPQKPGSGFDYDSYLGGSGSNPSSDPIDKIPDALSVIPAVGMAKAADAVVHDPKGTVGAWADHAVNRLTLGHMPQLTAKLAPITDRVDNLVGAGPDKPMDWDQLWTNGPEYTQRRDELVQRLKDDSKNYPISSALGDIHGIVGTMAASPMAEAPGAIQEAAPLLSKVASATAKGGAAGFVYGAAQNPGDTPGQVDPLQAEARAKNGALSAAIGAGIGGVSAAGSKFFGGRGPTGPDGSGASGAAQDFAEQKAFKATGANKADFTKAFSKDKVNEIGRDLLDQGVITPLATPAKIAGNLEGKINELDDQLGDRIQFIDQKLKDPQFISSLSPDAQAKITSSQFNPQKTAEALKQEIIDRYSNVPREKIQPALDEIDSWLASKSGTMGPAEAQATKQQMNSFLKDADFYRTPGIQKQGTLAVRRGLRKGVEDATDAFSEATGEDPGGIAQINRKMGNLIQAQDAAEGAQSRAAANRAFGLTDTIAGGAGAETGAMIGGMAAGPPGAKVGAVAGGVIGGGGNKLARTFGPSLQATGADALSRVLANGGALTDLIAKNPQAAPVLMSMLNQPQSAPAQPNKPSIDPGLMQLIQKNPQLIDTLSDENLKGQLKRLINRQTSSER